MLWIAPRKPVVLVENKTPREFLMDILEGKKMRSHRT